MRPKGLTADRLVGFGQKVSVETRAAQAFRFWFRSHTTEDPVMVEAMFNLSDQIMISTKLKLVNFGEKFGNQRVHGYMSVFQVYGSVFFTTIVFSPVFGKYIERIGSRNLFLLGTLIAGIANIGFGFLQWIDKAYPFLMLSLIIRIISGMGEAAFFTAVYPLTFEVRSFNNLFFTKEQSKIILFLFFRYQVRNTD